MIKVKHPLQSCNEVQEATLKHLPGHWRRFHELLFSYGNAISQYRREAARSLGDCRAVSRPSENAVEQEEFARRLMGEEEYWEYRDLQSPLRVRYC